MDIHVFFNKCLNFFKIGKYKNKQIEQAKTNKQDDESHSFSESLKVSLDKCKDKEEKLSKQNEKEKNDIKLNKTVIDAIRHDKKRYEKILEIITNPKLEEKEQFEKFRQLFSSSDDLDSYLKGLFVVIKELNGQKSKSDIEKGS